MFAALTLAACAVAGCTAEVATEIDDRDADEIVVVLDRAGIGADKIAAARGDGYRVRVDRAELAHALAVLREHDLPRDRSDAREAMAARSSLIPSLGDERARALARTGAELAETIESMPAVERARIHLTEAPRGRALDDTPSPVRASALIHHAPGARPDDDAIKALIAGAVADLEPTNIAIVSVERPPRAPEARLAQVGPFAVARASAAPIGWTLATSFALNLILAVLLVLGRRRSASKQAQRSNHATTSIAVESGGPGAAKEI